LAATTPKPTSLIDSIGTGYRVLNSRLWVLIIPLVLDAILLLGTPPLYATPLLEELRRQAEAGLQELPTEQREAWQQQLEGFQEASARDLRGQFAWLNWVPTRVDDEQATRAGLTIDSLRGLALAVLQINLVALLLSGIFLAPLADGVRQEATTLSGWSGGAGRVVLGVLCYVGIVLGASITLGLPFLVLIALLLALGPGAALVVLAIAAILLQMLVFAGYVYCGFAVEAILIDRIGPLRALGRSFRLVQHNFWSAIGLIGVLLLINEGMVVIWQQIDERLPGRLLAIVGTAYIGAGLTAARMVFYRERSRGRATQPAPHAKP
jgi:hypothetical protein